MDGRAIFPDLSLQGYVLQRSYVVQFSSMTLFHGPRSGSQQLKVGEMIALTGGKVLGDLAVGSYTGMTSQDVEQKVHVDFNSLSSTSSHENKKLPLNKRGMEQQLFYSPRRPRGMIGFRPRLNSRGRGLFSRYF